MVVGVAGLVVVSALVLLAVLVVAVGLPALTRGRLDHPAPALPPVRSTWRAAHRSGPDGTTLVVVERVEVDGPGRAVLERRVLAELDDRDPGYDQAFLEAMAAARERAALLRSEDGDL